MIFIPLLLTSALDLSRPEFEPMPDASGNYIIAEIDDVSGSFVVEEVPEIPDTLTLSVFAQENVYDSGEIIYDRDGSGSVSGTRITGWRFRYDSLKLTHTNGYAIRYINLQMGYTYTFTTDYENGVFTVPSLSDGADLVSVSSPYTPTSNCVALVPGSYNLSASFVASGNEPDNPSGNDPDAPSGNDPDYPSGGDFDDSRLLVALGSITAQLSVLELLLLFNCLFPLTRKSVHKLMNRKED